MGKLYVSGEPRSEFIDAAEEFIGDGSPVSLLILNVGSRSLAVRVISHSFSSVRVCVGWSPNTGT
jgi:hypothetical protein